MTQRAYCRALLLRCIDQVLGERPDDSIPARVYLAELAMFTGGLDGGACGGVDRGGNAAGLGVKDVFSGHDPGVGVKGPLFYQLRTAPGARDEGRNSHSDSFSIQGRKQLTTDALHGTGPVDTDVARHAGAAALRELLVVIDERLGLAMVCFQARLHGVLGIVGTLYERLPRNVILARYLWRMVSDVISTARRRVDATPREAFQHFVIAHVELDHVVESYACRVQGVGLRDGAGKAIHDEPVRAIFFLDALFDELDHHAVRDELAFVHILFSFLAERRARLHRGA